MGHHPHVSIRGGGGWIYSCRWVKFTVKMVYTISSICLISKLHTCFTYIIGITMSIPIDMGRGSRSNWVRQTRSVEYSDDDWLHPGQIIPLTLPGNNNSCENPTHLSFLFHLNYAAIKRIIGGIFAKEKYCEKRRGSFVLSNPK